MSSEAHDRRVRNLLLLIVFQFGICLVVLAAIADGVAYGDLVPTVARLLGGVTALGALLFLFRFESGFE